MSLCPALYELSLCGTTASSARSPNSLAMMKRMIKTRDSTSRTAVARMPTRETVPLSSIFPYNILLRLTFGSKMKEVGFLVMGVFAFLETIMTSSIAAFRFISWPAALARFFLYFALPVFLFVVNDRALRHMSCTYHPKCNAMAVLIPDAEQEIGIKRELLLAFLYLTSIVLRVAFLGSPEYNHFKGLGEKLQIPDGFVTLLHIVNIVSIVHVAYQILLTTFMVSFETKHAHLTSCPDCCVSRWSRLKGSIIVTALGCFAATGFDMLFLKFHLLKMFRSPFFPYHLVFPSLVVYVATHQSRRLRLIGIVCVWCAWAVKDVKQFGFTDATVQLLNPEMGNHFYSVLCLGMMAFCYNLATDANNLFLWSAVFREYLRNCLMVACLAVFACEANRDQIDSELIKT